MDCIMAARGSARYFEFDLVSRALLYLKQRLARQLYFTALYFTSFYFTDTADKYEATRTVKSMYISTYSNNETILSYFLLPLFSWTSFFTILYINVSGLPDNGHLVPSSESRTAVCFDLVSYNPFITTDLKIKILNQYGTSV